MTDASGKPVNVRQAVPFFRVTDMQASLRFYREGLGFEMTRSWIPDERIRWCWLELGEAAIMLQEFTPARQSNEALGAGTSVSFMCEDALALYREFKTRAIQPRTRPFVGNGLWVVSLSDPDDYLIDFSSPTDAPEESELQE